MNPRPHTVAKYANGGFTLIELLVTMTIFGLILSSVVLGLRSGIASWLSLQQRQSYNATREQAIELLRNDIQSIHIVDEEIPAITEISDEVFGDAVSMTLLGRVPTQEAEAGFVWATVTYRVGAAEGSNRPALLRAIRPMAGPSTLSGGGSEMPLLEGVRFLRVGYINRGETWPVWQDDESLPLAVEVHIEFDSGPPVTRSFPLMIGMLNAGAQS